MEAKNKRCKVLAITCRYRYRTKFELRHSSAYNQDEGSYNAKCLPQILEDVKSTSHSNNAEGEREVGGCL